MKYKVWTGGDVVTLIKMLDDDADFKDIAAALPEYKSPGIARKITSMGRDVPHDYTGLRCGKCGSADLSIVDSRPAASSVRRRRRCNDCNFRFTTFEREVEPVENLVQVTAILSAIRKLFFKLEGIVEIEEIDRFLKR